jgi:hypothetical protein
LGQALTLLEDVSPKQFKPAPLGDLRFRALLGDDEWFSLPACVRARFSKRLAAGDTAVYVGRVTEVRMSRAGRLLVQLARLIGGPFPTSTDVGVASVVTVTENAATGGQTWTRLYARKRGIPQVIHSTKLFAGPTGLEEHVGGGVSMRLKVRVEGRDLVFRSRDYFFGIFGLSIALPRWMTPGALTVTHTDNGEGWFTFTLDVEHPLLGTLIHQCVAFRESTS